MQKCLGTVAMVLLVAAVEAEICNNGCGNTTESFCDKRKWRNDGTVEQCVDRTIYGGECAASCKKGDDEDFYWCQTSWHLAEEWEYCGSSGQTRYDVRCVSECAQKGKDYWWCYTAQDGSKWEYCSPPSQVKAKKVTYTVYGQECTGDCGTHGEKYWWCKKTPRWSAKTTKGKKSHDSSWDYCSPQAVQNTGSQNSSFEGESLTRYNAPCKDACESRGEDYFWCHTSDSWDYCSPKVAATGPVITKGGMPCVGICDTMGKSYKWCAVMNAGKHLSWSDYCGEKTQAWYMSWLPGVIAYTVLIVVVVVVYCLRH